MSKQCSLLGHRNTSLDVSTSISIHIHGIYRYMYLMYNIMVLCVIGSLRERLIHLLFYTQSMYTVCDLHVLYKTGLCEAKAGISIQKTVLIIYHLYP